ncbi:hypothetical protein J1N09_14395 [Aureitalea sp. L0-47]|uniref:hypothetical protein n=1 Tax=Aureitalea sp. L0-47 TaxID=2816962 RepID=UPI002238F400|nr:hypothetical protein [Aureitalea sp. L0-47]MCW5521036.1 hypothetical protein [Aureitalea sp. L0-47]
MSLKALLFAILFALPILNGLAHPAWGIAVDEQGNIYFTDIFHNERGSLWKLHFNGTLELLLSDFHAHNVSLDVDGNPVSAHGEEHHTMVRLKGSVVSDTLYSTTDIEEFFGGNCTYTKAGDILFGINKKIWRIDTEGNLSAISNHRFEWNQGLFSDTDGNVYAPDIGRDNGAVIKIDTSGQANVIATELITLTNGEFDPHQDVLLGIGKDKEGWLYIAETAGKRIIKFSEEGERETFFTAEGDWFPCGITFQNGSAYILESKMDNGYEGPQITKVSVDGSSEVIFNYESYQAVKTTGTEEKNENDNETLNLFWISLGLVLIVLMALVIYRKLQPPLNKVS